MNIILKGRRTGSINEVYKEIRKIKNPEDLKFGLAKIPPEALRRLLIVCGRVGDKNVEKYHAKAREIDADFMALKETSWVFVMKEIRENFEAGKHDGILLIGDNKQLPASPIGYQGTFTWTDFFTQDVDNDGIPETPVGRIYGKPETVLYHMDPTIIDSNVAVIFDTQPGRSMRHVKGLAELGFDVEVLKKYTDDAKTLLEVCEFILQFSDGVYTKRIHGTPEAWASHNSVILAYKQTEELRFRGYPVVYAEACSTAREGPLLRAFLDSGACYIGAMLDTANNIRPFDNWRECAYCDGWKFGFLDLLDTYPYIGQVKVNVDREIYEHLSSEDKKTIENIRTRDNIKFESETVVSTIEWQLFGNPMRTTTVGPEAEYTPGRLVVDT